MSPATIITSMTEKKCHCMTCWRDYLYSALLYPLPQHWISRLTLRLTRIKTTIKNPIIRWFIRHHQIDMSEAAIGDITQYADFNAFFTRELKHQSRPVDTTKDAVVSPVDGTISQIGQIHDGTLIQAKGRDYSVLELLGGQNKLTKHFQDGCFTTLYLSPRDYHRIHMPMGGKLEKMLYVPGRLFSVAAHTVRTIPKLFARNERVIAYFSSPDGPFVMVLVGAINVAAIETVWHGGLVTPPHKKVIAEYNYHDIEFSKGQEMGRFNLGSTVVLLTTNKISWLHTLATGSSIRFGQRIGVIAD